MLTHRLIASQVLSALLAINVATRPAFAAEDAAPPSTSLLKATLGRDWEKAAKLLASGDDPKQQNEFGLTPLMAAAIAGHVPTIKALLANGAPTETVDARGRTALG